MGGGRHSTPKASTAHRFGAEPSADSGGDEERESSRLEARLTLYVARNSGYRLAF